MRLMLRSRSQRIVAAVGVLLIMVASLIGLVGCSRAQYVLNLSSTQGGTVTIPGEGALPYPSGATVVLLAQPDPGYRFVNWTGDVRAIKDVNSSSTIVVIMGNYTITANFRWA